MDRVFDTHATSIMLGVIVFIVCGYIGVFGGIEGLCDCICWIV